MGESHAFAKIEQQSLKELTNTFITKPIADLCTTGQKTALINNSFRFRRSEIKGNRGKSSYYKR